MGTEDPRALREKGTGLSSEGGTEVIGGSFKAEYPYMSSEVRTGCPRYLHPHIAVTKDTEEAVV